MMHPIDFVFEMLANGRKAELVQMLDRFDVELQQKKTMEHASVYWFAHMFLQSVAGQLQTVDDYEQLDNDNFLSVWKDLGLFGIDRGEMEKMIRSES